MANIATQPYNKSFPITKSDTVDFEQFQIGGLGHFGLCDAIFVGGAGVVAVVFQDNSVQNFTCVAGEILPVKARRVNSTNTTATLLQALYYV